VKNPLHRALPQSTGRLAFRQGSAHLEAVNGPLKGNEHPLFARAFREHYPDLVAFLRRHVSSDVEAADIAQEAYVRVLRYRDEKDLTSLRMLVFRIALNLISSRARVVRNHRALDLVPLDDDLPLTSGTPSQDRQVAGEQQLRRLMAAIQKLPRKRRDALVLRRVHGLSVLEVSERMGISVKAVEMHIARAVASLEQKLGRDL
jgi:RNA polymerase sigma factor (sigma-70 family)